MPQVGGAEPGVDEDQSVGVGLDEQAVTHDGPLTGYGAGRRFLAEWCNLAQGTAVEVMNAHEDPL
jgi:hypothetical protein